MIKVPQQQYNDDTFRLFDGGSVADKVKFQLVAAIDGEITLNIPNVDGGELVVASSTGIITLKNGEKIINSTNNTTRFEGDGAGGYITGLEIDFDANAGGEGPTLKATTTKYGWMNYLYINSHIILAAEKGMAFYNPSYANFSWRGAGSAGDKSHLALQLAVNDNLYSGNFVFEKSGSVITNPPLVTCPTFRIQSSNSTLANCMKFWHDATDGNIETEAGNLILNPLAYIVLSSSKETTGDPTAVEGLLYWNTFDNVIKMYCEGAWRTLASW